MQKFTTPELVCKVFHVSCAKSYVWMTALPWGSFLASHSPPNDFSQRLQVLILFTIHTSNDHWVLSTECPSVLVYYRDDHNTVCPIDRTSLVSLYNPCCVVCCSPEVVAMSFGFHLEGEEKLANISGNNNNNNNKVSSLSNWASTIYICVKPLHRAERNK